MATDYSKFGIEANQPIDQNGNIAARLQNPDYIANTGAHWIRLNFVLPGPAYLDRYDAIINTFLNRNIKIYAAIGHDACGDFWLGDTLRDANNPNGADWISTLRPALPGDRQPLSQQGLFVRGLQRAERLAGRTVGHRQRALVRVHDEHALSDDPAPRAWHPPDFRAAGRHLGQR